MCCRCTRCGSCVHTLSHSSRDISVPHRLRRVSEAAMLLRLRDVTPAIRVHSKSIVRSVAQSDIWCSRWFSTAAGNLHFHSLSDTAFLLMLNTSGSVTSSHLSPTMYKSVTGWRWQIVRHAASKLCPTNGSGQEIQISHPGASSWLTKMSLIQLQHETAIAHPGASSWFPPPPLCPVSQVTAACMRSNTYSLLGM